jgi:3-deoxy-D-manno-octulosonic-acid transferase
MYLLYNIALLLALPLVLAYHLYRSISRGRPPALMERFGFIDSKALLSLQGNRPIWIHAVSVGETIAVKPLLSALKKEFPEIPLVVSNMTETGRSISLGIKEADCSIYFPFDYSFSCDRLLKIINPHAVIIVETELWPNFLRSARNMSIPTVIVNGRISDRSFQRYMKMSRFFRPMLAAVTAFCMQSEEDARRIVAIGAVSGQVRITRNLKFDIPGRSYSVAELQKIRSGYLLDGSMALLTAGSTHPGEDEQVLDAFAAIIAEGKQVTLVLVPRHPERAAEVADLLTRRGYAFFRRSSLAEKNGLFASNEVLLVDTIGELMNFYAISDLAFVGGSLVPAGGHNLLEPASSGCPVLFGPHMANFREIAALTVAYGAGCQIKDAEDLAFTSCKLLADGNARSLMGENGRRLLREQGGATELNMEVIGRLVKGEG